MKIFIKLIIIGLLLIIVLACSEDKKDKVTEPTGYDFTTTEWSDDVDYYFLITNINGFEPFPIRLYSKQEVFSSELTINNISIETEGKWTRIDDYIFSWECVFLQSDLQNPIYYECGNTFIVSLTINGENLVTTTSLPDLVTLNYSSFSSDEDFIASWQQNNDPMASTAAFFLFDSEDCFYDEYISLSPSKRTCVFSKENYCDFDMTDLETYSFGIDSFNYDQKDNFILLAYHYSGGSMIYESKSTIERAESLLKEALTSDN